MSDDDFKFEPVRGLPERLPADEHILWQGSPAPLRLARDALGLRWVAGYFALLVIWRIGASLTAYPLSTALLHAVPFIVAGLVACGLICGLAWIYARTTVYTLTNKRVAMRIGAALTLTLNLPYTWIGTAQADIRSDGTGTIALELIGDTRLGYLMTWPHVRPWHIKRTQPALRSIPDAAAVARIFAEAAEMRVSMPQLSRVDDAGHDPIAIAAE